MQGSLTTTFTVVLGATLSCLSGGNNLLTDWVSSSKAFPKKIRMSKFGLHGWKEPSTQQRKSTVLKRGLNTIHILISLLCNIFIVSFCIYSAYFSGGRHSMRLTLVFVMTWLMRRSRAAGLTISSRETRTNSTTATHGESHTKTWWQDLNLSSWSWRGKTVYLSLDIRLSTGKKILNHRNGNKVRSF